MMPLVNVAAGATVVFAGAWVLAWSLGRAPADLRRTVWRAAFVAVGVLPFVPAIPVGGGLTGETYLIGPAAAATSAAAIAAGSAPVGSWWPWLWAAGAALVLARTIAGLRTVARWSRAAETVDGYRYSDAAAVPLTWGAWRPEILLPAAARDWTDQTRGLVMRHERAHIAHHDWAWQLFARGVTAVLWFHPLAWVADRALRREAERAADDAVITSGACGPDYADQLVRLARSANAPALATVAMAQRSGLESRVRYLLDARTARRPASTWSIAAVVAGMMVLTAVGAAAQGTEQGEVVYTVGADGVSAPKVLREVPPVYPPEALEDRIEGLALLEAVVNKKGLPTDIKVIKSLAPVLDRAAVDTLLEWRFEPATLDGKPVSVIVQVEFEFRLK